MSSLKCLAALMLLGLILFATSPATAQQSWNFADDFSKNANPNHDWTYGYVDGPGFHRYAFVNAFIAVPTHWYWCYASASQDNSGSVEKEFSTDPLQIANCIYAEPGMGFLHGASASYKSVARWTSPVTGDVGVNARFTGQYYADSGTQAQVQVVHNGAVIFDQELHGFIGRAANNYSDGFGAQRERIYSATVAVSAGETVDFVTKHIGTKIYDGYLGFSATITALSPTGNIQGCVTANTAESQPLVGATVRVVGEPETATTGSDGRYSLRLAPGTYTLQAAYGELDPVTSAPLTVTSGNTTTKDFSLSAAVIRGVVSISDIGPAVGATVSAVGTTLSTLTGSDGRYSLMVRPGTVTVEADLNSYAKTQASVTVSSGETRTQNLTLTERWWSFENDFSKTANPSEDWSYGYMDGTGFNLYAHVSSLSSVPTHSYWCYASGTQDSSGSVEKEFSASAQQIANCIYAEPGMGMLHSADASKLTVVRWTSPIDGSVRVSARFTGQYYADSGTQAQVQVVHNGAVVFDQELHGFIGRAANNYSDGFGAQRERIYSATVAVSAGETVDFVTKHIGVQNYDGYVGLRATIIVPRGPDEKLADVKTHQDGEAVATQEVVVTAAFEGESLFYVEDADRSNGIRVHWPGHTLPSPGTTAMVRGAIYGGTGERFIEAATFYELSVGTVKPVGISVSRLGGESYRYEPNSGAGQRGIPGRTGLNNIGLLVRSWGRVSQASGRRFKLADGSGANVTVELPCGVVPPYDDPYVGITGISSCETDTGGNLLPLLKAVRATKPYDEKLTTQYAWSILKPVLPVLGREVKLVDLSGSLSGVPSQLSAQKGLLGKEGFTLYAESSGPIWVGADTEQGLLYGCDEIVDRCRDGQNLQGPIFDTQIPAMPLRAVNFTVSPNGFGSWRDQTPITRSRVPWFYDMDQWRRNLDELAANRFNAIVWWSTHPFPQFMSFDQYPEVQDVSPEELEDNIRTMSQITAECKRRGIWFVIFFYNIHYSPSFAQYHNIPAAGVDSPLTRDYTKYWLSEWIKRYPNAGLMTAGAEAISTPPDEWIADVILPGIKAGLEPGQRQPPLILRAYYLDIGKFKTRIAPNYDNLYTMWKYNNETVSVDQPDPSHAEWIAASKCHGINVHTVSNLKPYRWCPPSFIQRMMSNSYDMGIRWLHLYSMWYEWPWSGDRITPPLEQTERDWAYYEAFGRYSWNPKLDPLQENDYWAKRFSDHFGVPAEQGAAIRDAMEESGEINPMLSSVLYLGGNTDPARTWQPVSGPAPGMENFGWGVDFHVYAFGATIDQLCQCPGLMSCPPAGAVYTPQRPWPGGPLSPSRFVDAEFQGQSINVLTPLDAADTVEQLGQSSESRLSGIAVTRQGEEFNRLKNDVKLRHLTADFYAEKIRAAVDIKRWIYKLEKAGVDDHSLQDGAIQSVQRSLDVYRQLSTVADAAYVACTDFYRQTPIPNVKNCSQVIPTYEAEFNSLPAKFDAARQTLAGKSCR